MVELSSPKSRNMGGNCMNNYLFPERPNKLLLPVTAPLPGAKNLVIRENK